METTICIEADDPKRIWRGNKRDIHFSRSWPKRMDDRAPEDLQGAIVVRPANMDVVRSLRAAVKVKRDEYYPTAWMRKPRPDPLAERLFRLVGGRHPPLSRIEIVLDDPATIDASGDGDVISLGSTRGDTAESHTYCILGLRNVPSAERIIEILDEMIEEDEQSPYGSNSEYAKKKRAESEDERMLIAHLRGGMSVEDSAIGSWGDPDIARWVRGMGRRGDRSIKARLLELIKNEIPNLKYPPTWAQVFIDRVESSDANAGIDPAAKQRAASDDERVLIDSLHDRLSYDPDTVFEGHTDAGFVEWLRGVEAGEDPWARATLLELIEDHLDDLEHPPSWAKELIDRAAKRGPRGPLIPIAHSLDEVADLDLDP